MAKAVRSGPTGCSKSCGPHLRRAIRGAQSCTALCKVGGGATASQFDRIPSVTPLSVADCNWEPPIKLLQLHY